MEIKIILRKKRSFLAEVGKNVDVDVSMVSEMMHYFIVVEMHNFQLNF